MPDAAVALLADLAAEQNVLDTLLATAPPDGWRRPTPARGWDVGDTVQHLLVSERAALASLVDDCDPLAALRTTRDEDDTADEPEELIARWRTARAATLHAFAGRDGADRVPWGGRRMSVQSLATARLMECWAHGLDCFAALDARPIDTDRLVHISWLGWRTLGYAFAVAGETPPASPDELRLELRAPGGARWSFGPEGATARVRGEAGVWCRIVTHRWRDPVPPPLRVDGELARRAVAVARAFL